MGRRRLLLKRGQRCVCCIQPSAPVCHWGIGSRDDGISLPPRVGRRVRRHDGEVVRLRQAGADSVEAGEESAHASA